MFVMKKAFPAADKGLGSLDAEMEGTVRRLMAARTWARATLGA